MALNWGQLADGDAVACDREARSRIERSHDFTARVAQPALCQLASHRWLTVEQVLRAGSTISSVALGVYFVGAMRGEPLNDTERGLLAAALEGDGRAYRELVELYHSELHAHSTACSPRLPTPTTP